jgi:capsular polysaccharide transport system ATP-binding protein
MIFLRSVTKAYFSKHDAPKVVFRPTTIALPTDRRVAILGDRQQGKSVLLRLLAGQEAPDAGEVIAPLRLSPITNSRTLFQPRLSALENIRLIARMLGIYADDLTRVVDAFSGLGSAMEKPAKLLNGAERQRLQLTLVALLPFDCYLLDNAASVPTEWLVGYLNAAARRGAGTIFATTLLRQVYEYADFAVVIRDCTVRAFKQAEEAGMAYERRAG